MTVDSNKPSVGLFVTCLIDLLRPKVAFATTRLLEAAGCDVHVPECQTCCGQPGYNGGDQKSAVKIARKVIEAFEPFDYVVAPSGSCIGMIRCHYSGLFNEDDQWQDRAEKLAAKSYELTAFLVDVRKMKMPKQAERQSIVMHDSCSALRELGIHGQPRRLLNLKDLDDGQKCCGFGGLFSVKYDEISAHLADKKIAAVTETGADTLTSCDYGCLVHLKGRIDRKGIDIKVHHIAELLAEQLDGT